MHNLCDFHSFHLFSKNLEPIGLKFYMSFYYDNAFSMKDGIFYMHNKCNYYIIMHNTCRVFFKNNFLTYIIFCEKNSFFIFRYPNTCMIMKCFTQIFVITLLIDSQKNCNELNCPGPIYTCRVETNFIKHSTSQLFL